MQNPRLFFVGCALFPSLLLSQEVASTYQIADLAGGSNRFGIVYAMNAHGEVVGDSNFQACIWSHGTMSIPRSLGNGFSTARGINDLGQVVGGAAPNGNSVAFLLDHGVVTNLLTPTGAVYGLAVAINNNGQVLVNGGAGNLGPSCWHKELSDRSPLWEVSSEVQP